VPRRSVLHRIKIYSTSACEGYHERSAGLNVWTPRERSITLKLLEDGFHAHFSFLLAGILFVSAVGCARPPQGTIERARSAVATARASGAALYAPDSLAAAERAIAALETELSTRGK